MRVIDKHTNRELSIKEILAEANRDHSDEFQPYTMSDWKESPEDVLDWIDPQYFTIIRQYTIEELFQSVNDIYSQYDEGKIPIDQANRILKICCRTFIENLEGKKHEPRKHNRK